MWPLQVGRWPQALNKDFQNICIILHAKITNFDRIFKSLAHLKPLRFPLMNVSIMELIPSHRIGNPGTVFLFVCFEIGSCKPQVKTS
uniref:Uncharacterized protein n=1 Tax=Nothoprocta perdicaria TaxID=30464 RepID=A0A8C6ZWZ8_NOTPE